MYMYVNIRILFYCIIVYFIQTFLQKPSDLFQWSGYCKTLRLVLPFFRAVLEKIGNNGHLVDGELFLLPQKTINTRETFFSLLIHLLGKSKC